MPSLKLAVCLYVSRCSYWVFLRVADVARTWRVRHGHGANGVAVAGLRAHAACAAPRVQEQLLHGRGRRAGPRGRPRRRPRRRGLAAPPAAAARRRLPRAGQPPRPLARRLPRQPHPGPAVALHGGAQPDDAAARQGHRRGHAARHE